MTPPMDADAWDERYRQQLMVWAAEPNDLFVREVADLAPGRALDLAAGEGRVALWLAARGWRVTAVDFSRVALDKGRRRETEAGLATNTEAGLATNTEAGLAIEWVEADLTRYRPEAGAYDLVALLYLQVEDGALRAVLSRAAAALAPGGLLVALGHDKENLTRGVGGPQDPDVLWSAGLLDDADGAPAASVTIVRDDAVVRSTPAGDAIDRLLVARA